MTGGASARTSGGCPHVSLYRRKQALLRPRGCSGLLRATFCTTLHAQSLFLPLARYAHSEIAGFSTPVDNPSTPVENLPTGGRPGPGDGGGPRRTPRASEGQDRSATRALRVELV